MNDAFINYDYNMNEQVNKSLFNELLRLTERLDKIEREYLAEKNENEKLKLEINSLQIKLNEQDSCSTCSNRDSENNCNERIKKIEQLDEQILIIKDTSKKIKNLLNDDINRFSIILNTVDDHLSASSSLNNFKLTNDDQQIINDDDEDDRKENVQCSSANKINCHQINLDKSDAQCMAIGAFRNKCFIDIDSDISVCTSNYTNDDDKDEEDDDQIGLNVIKNRLFDKKFNYLNGFLINEKNGIKNNNKLMKKSKLKILTKILNKRKRLAIWILKIVD